MEDEVVMSAFDWESFLRQWSQEILASIEEEEKRQLPPEVLNSGWLGYPGATEAQIARAEARLRVKLPPSYREFLKVSNGWRQTAQQSDNFNHRFWSIEDIERFSVRHQQWIKAFSERLEATDISLDDDYSGFDDCWEPIGISNDEYFVYGECQDPSTIRIEYLKTAIEISDVGFDSIYLLNPQVVTADGEWEAWFIAEYLHGVDRYRSFREMMEAEYRNYLELRETEAEAMVSSRGRDSAVQAGLEPVRAEPVETTLSAKPTSDRPAMPVEPPSVSTTIKESVTWQSQKQLTVEFQHRQVNGRTEFRTVVSAGGFSQSQTWPGFKDHQLQLWLQQNLAEAEAIHFHESTQALAPPVAARTAGEISTTPAISDNTLSTTRLPASTHEAAVIPSEVFYPKLDFKIEQLAIHQPSNPAAQIFVRPDMLQRSKQTRMDSLASRQAFSVEVAFHLANQQLANLISEDIFYKVQVYVQNRTTHQWTELGVTHSNPLEKGRITYSATLFNQTLESGLYRLQAITTLSGRTTALSSFELPLLNVV